MEEIESRKKPPSRRITHFLLPSAGSRHKNKL